MYSGLCRSAAFIKSYKSISPMTLLPTTSPKPDRTTPGIQFGCGKLISLVSSMETIFDSLGINKQSALSVEVFPAAVPPAINALMPFSTASHIYATISDDMVWNSMRSGGENGSSLNFLIVNVDPFVVTSVLKVIWIRDPSGMVASSIGSEIEICFPHFCASFTTKSVSSSSSLNCILLFKEPYRRWYKKINTPEPSQEISSIFGSFMMTSSFPRPIDSFSR